MRVGRGDSSRSRRDCWVGGWEWSRGEWSEEALLLSLRMRFWVFWAKVGRGAVVEVGEMRVRVSEGEAVGSWKKPMEVCARAAVGDSGVSSWCCPGAVVAGWLLEFAES